MYISCENETENQSILPSYDVDVGSTDGTLDQLANCPQKLNLLIKIYINQSSNVVQGLNFFIKEASFKVILPTGLYFKLT